MPLPLSAWLESIFVIAGHTDARYQFRESGGGDDGGGIGVVPIVAVLVLTLVTIGLLVGLDRPERLKSLAPAAFLGVIIVVPLVLWTVSAGSDDRGSLLVERGADAKGVPGFVVSIADKKLNRLKTTKGKKTVRLECFGRKGQMLVNATQRWPFFTERGFPYPHIHQPATLEQLQQADRCRLRGSHVRLEADVEGFAPTPVEVIEAMLSENVNRSDLTPAASPRAA